MAKGRKQEITSADVMLNKMKFRDVKAACIMLGMDFDQVVNSDWHQLKSYYVENYGNRMEKTRLEQFEDYVAEKLLNSGYSSNDPIVKFRQFSTPLEDDEDDTPKLRPSVVKKAGAKKEKRKKKDRDESGLFKGTKKAYVFSGVRAGAKDSKIIEKTMKKFPDAKEKSIKIWIKKARKSLS